MEMEEEEIIENLRKCRYSKDAKRSYDIMRGGFIWSDELPNDDIIYHMILARAIGYRGSLSLGEKRDDLEEDWLKIKELFPDWPGFREDRIYGQVAKDLRLEREQDENFFGDFFTIPWIFQPKNAIFVIVLFITCLFILNLILSR
ncbi:hypothetical protein [Candidatus Uabimicrobium amorphum]|uniref:Uncharacterized protein n=1 Tax=Uabimicrobium amorphum TaxID=2596890 RepID=A0A5S9IND4_UABAM|nr:hypothetical protein [Candidatus Uabimicrobium amorphum]BBM84711.1 hypothetical protein UABAM_03072 [Candidatus Uabimicrobium amorphum]